MTAERWEDIERILDQVLDAEPESRPLLLEVACAGDAKLRQAVETMLAAEASAPAFLEGDAVGFAAPLLVESEFLPGEMEGTAVRSRRLGAYRVIREIGSGGMSVVYLAERDDGQFARRVAIKMLRYSFDPDLVRRFQTERELLAVLNHASIAQILDGGVAPGGQPYLVAEFVDGGPITQYCDARRLTVGERLELFDQVAGAVQYAHQHLIVHRDLKPANILVTKEGAVKLLDFGIAKLLDGDRRVSGPAAVTTQADIRLMTPAYASPEQLTGNPATTATDVYALGVVLYEMLAGVRPFDVEGLSAREVETLICEREPARPSAHVFDARTAERRRSTPARLRHQLEGDLDTIILKALRKEPEQRYGSVRELCDDLHRLRAGLPVTARPATSVYRLRKFVRRHRLGASVAAFVAAMALVFTAALVVEREKTIRERDRAQAAAVEAETVTGFLTDLFEANIAGGVRSDTISVRTLLSRGADRVTELDGQPEVQARLFSVMGRVYRSLGRYELAQSNHERALEVRRRHFGSEHPAAAASLSDLGLAYRDIGDYPKAESLYREAIRLQRLGDDPLMLAGSLNNLAVVLKRAGRYSEAEPLYHEALEMRRRMRGAHHEEVAESVNNLAALHLQLGNYAVAESLYADALEMRRRLHGNEHVEVAFALNNLAGVLKQQGVYEEAEPLYRQALSMRRRLLGENHPAVAQSLNNIAALLQAKRDPAGAEPLLRQALQMNRSLLGSRHPEVAMNLNNLALTLSDQKRYAEAEPLYRETVEIMRHIHGDRHPNVAVTLNNLGRLFRAQDRSTEAERLFRESLEIKLEAYGDVHPSVANSLMNLGELLSSQGRYAEARPLLEKAVDVRRQTLGQSDPRVLESEKRLAEVVALASVR